jgi:hypothetical protein
MTDSQQTVCFAPDVVLQVIEGEALILKLRDEVVFSLNETGARIAQLIADGQRIDVVVDTLSREYGIDRDAVKREVQGLVGALLSNGLLVAGRIGAAE